MNIIAQPAFSNKELNPYNYLLYSKVMENSEFQIDEGLTFKKLFSTDLVHMHWPEQFLVDKKLSRLYLSATKLMFKLILMKMLNVKLIWTVHNLQPHECRSSLIKKVFYKFFPKFCDGFIFLSQTNVVEAKRKGLINDKTLYSVIRHGHYKEVYKFKYSKAEARSLVGLSPEAFYITFIGQVRPYKNVPTLIEQFSKASIPNCRLLIAGSTGGEKFLKSEIETLVSQNENSQFMDKFLNDDDMELILTASDLVVLPYSNITNSGSVLLALSFSKPVLAPQLGSLAEVQIYVGEDYLMLYKGDLTSTDIQEAVKKVSNTNIQCNLDLSVFDWKDIAIKTIDFYREVVSK